MTRPFSVLNLFRKEFSEFECMRMYPPEYSKETVMTKPKMRHCSAIVRAINLLETGINVESNPTLATSIQKDILLLCEVKEILHNLIENPTLPFVIPQPDSVQPILDQIENAPDEAI